MYKLTKNDGQFSVIETPYGLEVVTKRRKKEAVEYLTSLLGGSGFQGHTPPFFLQSFNKIPDAEREA